MSQKTFSATAGIIFGLIAILHALRLIYQWDAVIGGWHVPTWLSWLALVIAAYLAKQGITYGRKSL